MTSSVPPHHKTFNAYKKAFRFFRSGVVWLDEAGVIIGTNRKASELLKYTEAKLQQKNIFEIDPRLNLLQWKKTWRALLENTEYHKETEYITSDGLLIPVAVDGVLLTFGETASVLFVIEDLMESHRLKDLLSVTSSAAKVGSWALDLVRNEVTITGECQRLLGLEGDISVHPSGDFMNQLTGLISPVELVGLQEKLVASIKNGINFEVEVIFEPKAGQFRRLSINGFSQQSELEQTVKVYGAVKDISNFEARTEDLYLTQFSIDYANEMIFWFRPDGSIAYANRAVCDKLGYTRDELMALKAQDIAPDFDQSAREELWKALREKKYLEFETELLTKDHQLFPLYSSLNYIKFKGQEFNCVFSTDYTERKKAQEQLLLSQFTLENAQEMILWVDADGEIIFVNNRFYDLTGYTAADLQSIHLDQLYIGAEGPLSKQMFWQDLHREKQLEVETDFTLKDGRQIPVYCSFNYINFEGKELNCIFMRDWTKKKRRDEEIELAKSAFEIAGECIFWVDEQGLIKFTNQSASTILGFSTAELQGLPFNEICTDPLILDEEEVYDQREVTLKTRRNTHLPTELSRTRLEVDGRISWCLIARNISERKKKEEELAKARERVEELSIRLKGENVLLREEISNTYNFNNIITGSPNYRQVLKQVAQVADSNATVLILGETGTGKELLARAIHSLSDRDAASMVKINCAALPPNLIESELFGHEKGAFTGAVQQKKGRFEMADGGTIFLDELGEMPLDLQAKLLRVLQEGELERVGGTRTLKVDVRVVAATNRNLEDMVQSGKFREDLYYRLNVFPIINLPLRDRKEDIPLLIKHFTRKYSKQLGKNIEKVLDADIKALERYSFPGNIRELENMIERAVIISDGKTLNLKSSFDRSQTLVKKRNTKFLTFEEMQRQHIINALKRTNWRVTGPKGAARLLGLNDRTLASKMRKLAIKKEALN